MPPRRAHTKSRTGCLSCKRRRVKCDEVGPPCGPCASREIDCAYPVRAEVPEPPRAQFPTPDASQTASPPASAPHNTLFQSNQSTSISGTSDLELMHQWTSSTYKSLCGVPEANVPNWLEEEGFLWQTILPRDGLKHPFLMHGFLALAALELASLGINPSVDYVSAALEYHDIALAGFRSELVNVTPDNQQALIACSLITGLLSLTLPHFTKSRNVPQSMVTNMVVHYRLICGLATLISQNIDGLRASPILQIKKHLADPEILLRLQGSPMTPGQQGSIQHLPANELDYDTEEAMSTLKSLNEARYETMPTQSLNEKLQVMTNHAACRKAILYLEELFRRCLKTFTCGYTLAWLNLAGKDFVQAVETGDSVALLALMHWGVLVDQCKSDTWWAQGVGRSLVEELSVLLSAESDPILTESVVWARRKVGL